MIRPKIKKNQFDLIPQLQLASAPFKKKQFCSIFKFLAQYAALEVTPKSIAKVWIADGACIWSLQYGFILALGFSNLALSLSTIWCTFFRPK